MKNKTFVRLVAIMLVTLLTVGLFSVPTFAADSTEKVISDEEYTDLSYDNGTVIVKVDGGRLGEIIANRELNKEALLKLLPSGLYNMYKNRTKASIVDFLCTLVEKDVLTHEEMIRLFNGKSDILDLYVPAEYWAGSSGVETLHNMGAAKVFKDTRNFFVNVLTNEVDVMTCNGTQIFEGEPDWEFDHNAIQTVVLQALPDVQAAAELKDGDTILDLAFATTGPNVNFEFGIKIIVTGDCSLINKYANRFVDKLTYTVEDSGTVNATVTLNETFTNFYADVLNSDKFTDERKFELLGYYTLSGTELADALTNEDIDELADLASLESDARADEIRAHRELIEKVLSKLSKLASKSDTVEEFTSIVDCYEGDGVFVFTVHEEFSIEDLVNNNIDRIPYGDRIPESWGDYVSDDMHIIDQVTTVEIADFYRVRYYDADDNLLYVTFMPVGFDLTFLNDAAELQGHGADGWFDKDVVGGDPVTVMPDKDIDLCEVPTECVHTYGEPVWAWADDYSSATATFTCTQCGDIVTLDATVTSEEDTENGLIIYTATVTFENEEYTDTKSEPIPPCEHEYGEPEWAWADDYSSATATFTCTKCGETETLDATITSEEDTENGVIIYTATVTFNNEEYTDTKTEPIPECEHEYGEPEWAWADDYSSATATFTCTKCGETVTVTATVTTEEAEDGTITHTATVTFLGTVYTDVVTETPPPPTGEAFVWIAVAGAALLACPACIAVIVRRRVRAK